MSGIRTVIVDDDPAAQRLHSGYLAVVEGFTLVGVARTGASAARLVTRPGVDLVLLDMNLPDFSGIEVLHRMRSVRDWDVDVLVISSARDTTTVRQALSAHVVGYLVKPFTKEAFVSRLAAYRDSRSERVREAGLPLGQGDIDAIAAGRRDGPATTATLPLAKGLSASTLQLVREALDPVRASSVRDVVERSGASAPTVRRYLDHLTRAGEVTVSHRFGARGRPEVLYRRAVG
ncbi:response regulator [Microbacterium sp. 18062]|uniref:response regulator n=1 Tax=Microbacterium sp. 18062 TaxID=2681410 RepID=UPI00135B08A6|nr:response regulator [Microbacterium sp. 18062]